MEQGEVEGWVGTSGPYKTEAGLGLTGSLATMPGSPASPGTPSAAQGTRFAGNEAAKPLLPGAEKLPLQTPSRVGKHAARRSPALYSCPIMWENLHQGGPSALRVEVSAALRAVCSCRLDGRSSMFFPRPGNCGPSVASKEPCMAGDSIRANLRHSNPVTEAATEAAGGRALWLRPVIWGQSKQMISWGLSLSIKAFSVV